MTTAPSQPRKSPADYYRAPRPAAPSAPGQLFQFHNVATGTTLALATIEENGQAWFDASDVCRALGLSRPSYALRRLDEDEKGVRTKHTLGGEQQALFVNESGLYSLIFASRKEQARVFKRWITGTVLPAIRQHGGYINGMEALAPERQQETLVIVHEEALRVGLDAAEEREARSDAFKLLNRGRVRKKARR